MTQAKGFGDGILFRACNYLYWLLALTVLFALSNLLILPAMFLARDVSNTALFAVAALPLGPAITALLSCMSRFARERDLAPVADYLRAYRANLVETLRFWVPAVVVGSIVGADLGHLQRSDSALDGVLFAALIVLSSIGALWLVNVFLITAHFRFRTRDTLRLALFYLGRKPRATIGTAATMFVLAGAIVLTFDAVAILLCTLFAFMALAVSRDVVADVRARFTTSGTADASATTDSAPGLTAVAE